MLNTANILTLSRIAAIPLVVACFWLDRGWSQWLSMSLFVAAGITDYFFARRHSGRRGSTHVERGLEQRRAGGRRHPCIIRELVQQRRPWKHIGDRWCWDKCMFCHIDRFHDQ